MIDRAATHHWAFGLPPSSTTVPLEGGFPSSPPTPYGTGAASAVPGPPVEPGSPWQNPWVESYASPMRDELLAIEQFDTLLEAQVLVADWRDEYN